MRGWRRWGPSASVVALLVLSASQAASPHAAVAAAPRPDIVIIYMDDFSPRTSRLWSQPSRTPALARFVEHGLQLQAIASTPLCCPARGNLLTGRYGHDSGLTRNVMSSYDPRRTVATRLRRQGYHTAWIGKFLNGLRDHAPTGGRIRRLAQGWDDFDVIWENQGRFYDYRLWTRQGPRNHGRRARDHSSFVAGIRAVRRIRAAPARKPLFMVVSLVDGHSPIKPMPRFANHPSCRHVKPFRGPGYNEADVSDKPRYVQRMRRIGGHGRSLRGRCESIMTVDWVVRRVRQALRRTGRLHDTLLLFTADNGILMGEHRLLGKTYPYSTPVPMYAMWPARWGSHGRAIRDPVSNVDLAPTFCRLAGCSMPLARGMDITPLLDGAVDDLDRRYLYEEMLHPGGPHGQPRPAWYGIRTTLGFSETLWVYTEYATGEKELYDLSADPHQLENLARSSDHAGIRSQLRRILMNEVIEPHGVRFKRKRHP